MDRHLHASSQAFVDLQQRAARIGAVVEEVKPIARQTNLPAINAAIEAARSGPAGKSFSVVSGEVKRLAGRAHEAAAEIGHLAEGLSAACASAQAQVGQMLKVSARGVAHSAAEHEVFTGIQNGAAQRVQTVAAVCVRGPARPAGGAGGVAPPVLSGPGTPVCSPPVNAWH